MKARDRKAARAARIDELLDGIMYTAYEGRPDIAAANLGIIGRLDKVAQLVHFPHENGGECLPLARLYELYWRAKIKRTGLGVILTPYRPDEPLARRLALIALCG